jgi:hypothetical protein
MADATEETCRNEARGAIMRRYITLRLILLTGLACGVSCKKNSDEASDSDSSDTTVVSTEEGGGNVDGGEVVVTDADEVPSKDGSSSGSGNVGGSGSGDDGGTGSSDDGGTGDDGEPTCDSANPPKGFILGTGQSRTQSPTFSWSAPTVGCASTASFEIALGTTVGGNEVVDWTDVGSSLSGQFTGISPNLNHSIDFYISVRAIDGESNVSASISSSSWQRAFLPDDLTGLILWLDAADLSTLHTTDTCDSAVTVDAQLIACWQDKSGNGNHVKESNASFHPAYDDDGVNGLPAVEFEGTKWLQAPNSATLDVTNPGLTIAWVDDPDTIGPTAQYPINKESQYEVAYQNGRIEAAIETADVGAWAWGDFTAAASTGVQQNTFIHDDTEWRHYTDRVILDTIPPAANEVGSIKSNTTPVTIGGRNNGAAKSYDARMGEMIVYDNALSDGDRALVEAYLESKWGL